MRRNGASLMVRETATHLMQVQAAIGRSLRAEYDTAEPLPARLAELVTKIERSTSGEEHSI